MKELTVAEYAKLRGISHQAVYDAIGRKAIAHKHVMIAKKQLVIELEDDVFDRLVRQNNPDIKI